jgi:hypothetical protein
MKNRTVSLLILRMPGPAFPARRSRSAFSPMDLPLPNHAHMVPRFVEDKYGLEIGNAQNTQLSKAIATGAEKGHFVLPKG